MSTATAEDLRWLEAAIRLATPQQGTTADNPAIAAIVVDPFKQTVISRAVTSKGGRPHAESQAIGAAGFEAAGATLYVTLEPCRHWGRTPPCVDAIIRAGIMRVVIGMADPDPRMSGGSVAQLESAGVETVVVDHPAAKALYAGHALRHSLDRPYVSASLVVSSDNRIADADGNRVKPGVEAQRWLEMQQLRAGALLLGAATVRAEDLTHAVTLPGLAQRTPLRVVLVGPNGIDRKVNLIGGFSGHRTAIIAESTSPVDAPVSVETLRVAGQGGHPDLAAALRALAGKGIQNLAVEPGQRLLEALIAAQLPDRLALIRTDKVLGDGGLAASATGDLNAALSDAGLVEVSRRPLGDDELIIFERPQHAV